MTGYEETIDGWLAEDQRRPRKQRHTAKRVFDRLVAEHGFTGSYSAVQRYVKRFKARNRARGEGYAELVWPAGTAQVDFGQAEAIIAGSGSCCISWSSPSRFRTCVSCRPTAARRPSAFASGCGPSSSTSEPSRDSWSSTMPPVWAGAPGRE